jgi:pimeloyl-ACP methyl ester carboxylesterase
MNLFFSAFTKVPKMSTELTETFEHNGYKLKWTSFGPEHAQPLVFIHGTPWSSRLWAPIALAIAQSLQYCVYLFDNPGYGESHTRTADAEESPAQVSLADQAAAFAALAKDCWKFSKDNAPIVIAHDFGGVISLRANLIHGVHFKALFLADPVALRPTGSPFFRLVGKNADVFNAVPPSIFAGFVRAYISEGAFKPLPETMLQELAAPWLVSDKTRADFIAQIAQFDEQHIADVDGRYKEVTAAMPVKIVWAKNDYWIPVEAAYRLADAMGIAEKEVSIVENAGHLLQIDAPERLTAEIVSWLLKVKAMK